MHTCKAPCLEGWPDLKQCAIRCPHPNQMTDESLRGHVEEAIEAWPRPQEKVIRLLGVGAGFSCCAEPFSLIQFHTLFGECFYHFESPELSMEADSRLLGRIQVMLLEYGIEGLVFNCEIDDEGENLLDPVTGEVEGTF